MEQQTDRLAEIQAEQENKATKRPWEPVPYLVAEVQSLRAERDRLNKALLTWEDREAAVCPEDVGFEEVIKALEAERDTLREAIRWALGEEGEFGEEPEPVAGKYRRRYWWRNELRARAFPALSPQTAWSDGLNANGSHRFDCHECRVRGVIVDEEGCCRTCGHDAARVSPQTAEETQG